MSGFHDIIGHEKIIAHMQEAIREGKVSHAYILNGPADAGKKMLAEAFAMALQCSRVQEAVQEGAPFSQIDACGVCHSCRQALGHNQPDIRYVIHEKPKIISVQEVREQLVDDVGIRPYSSRYKVYIVDDAEKMNPQAQNAILKTIEEPPSYAVILLLTDNADSFLPTIRSRCVTLNLNAVSEERIASFLMKEYQVPDYRAEMLAAFSQGNVGMAVKLASSEKFGELKDIVVSQMSSPEDIPVYRLADEAARLEDFKDETQKYLDLLCFWFRDVLFIKAGADGAGLIFSDQRAALERQAAKCGYRSLDTIFREIDRAGRRLHANVNRSLTLEMLLMKIREAVAA